MKHHPLALLPVSCLRSLAFNVPKTEHNSNSTATPISSSHPIEVDLVPRIAIKKFTCEITATAILAVLRFRSSLAIVRYIGDHLEDPRPGGYDVCLLVVARRAAQNSKISVYDKRGNTLFTPLNFPQDCHWKYSRGLRYAISSCVFLSSLFRIASTFIQTIAAKNERILRLASSLRLGVGC